MSELLLNLETALQPSIPRKGSEAGSKKHQRFLRRRRFLERKGFLKQKQLPTPEAPAAAAAAAPWPGRDASRRQAAMEKKRPKPDRHHPRSDHRDGVGGDPGWGAWRKAVPKENAARIGAPPQPRALAPSGKAGRGAAKANGPRNEGSGGAGGLRRTDLHSEYDSGLPSAPVLVKPGKVVAIDCEMVGTGPGGRNSDLARCSIVGYYGDVIYDKYVRPANPITNYRTRWSGIRRHHMTNAVPFKAAQKEILKILSGKVVIGHAIHNDFKALKYFHPKSVTRDTSKIPLLNRKAGFPEHESASLKRLTKQLLHRDIQVGQNGHSSVEDARATMELYKIIEEDWESYLASSPAQD